MGVAGLGYRAAMHHRSARVLGRTSKPATSLVTPHDPQTAARPLDGLEEPPRFARNVVRG